MAREIKIRFSIVVLTVLATLCGIAYYYRSEMAQRLSMLEKSSDEPGADLDADGAAASKLSGEPFKSRYPLPSNLPVVPQGAATQSGLELPTLAQKSAPILSDEEKGRRDGYMWIDRVTDKYIVTLGNVNGVFPGGYLTVYDNENLVGQVRVVTAFDVISYVEPLESAKAKLIKEYYQVLVE